MFAIKSFTSQLIIIPNNLVLFKKIFRQEKQNYFTTTGKFSNPAHYHDATLSEVWWAENVNRTCLDDKVNVTADAGVLVAKRSRFVRDYGFDRPRLAIRYWAIDAVRSRRTSRIKTQPLRDLNEHPLMSIAYIAIDDFCFRVVCSNCLTAGL